MGYTSVLTKYFSTSDEGTSFTYTLSGVDSGYFNLENNMLKPNQSFDFENPVDADADNIYQFTITVEDNKGTSKSYNTNLHVKDKEIVSAGEFSDPENLEIRSISLDGDYMLVGTPYEKVNNIDRIGSAVLYKKDPNGLMKKIHKFYSDNTPSKPYQFFGIKVYIKGNYIAIAGSKEGSNSAGEVTIFKKHNDDSVTQIAKLDASGTSNDYFGGSIVIEDNYVLIGSDFNGSSVFLYKISNNDIVTNIAEIKPTTPTTDEGFGHSLSMHNNSIAISSLNYSNNTGSVYLFQLEADDTITELNKIISTNTENGTRFGSSVSINSNYLAIGEEYKDVGEKSRAGIINLYKRNNNNTITKISAIQSSDTTWSANFGRDIALNNNNYLSSWTNQETSRIKRAYLFKIENDNSIREVEAFHQTITNPPEGFGWSMGMSNTDIALGSARSRKTDQKEKIYLYRFE